MNNKIIVNSKYFAKKIKEQLQAFSKDQYIYFHCRKDGRCFLYYDHYDSQEHDYHMSYHSGISTGPFVHCCSYVELQQMIKILSAVREQPATIQFQEGNFILVQVLC